MSKDWKKRDEPETGIVDEDVVKRKDCIFRLTYAKDLPKWFSDRLGVTPEVGMVINMPMSDSERIAVKQIITEVK